MFYEPSLISQDIRLESLPYARKQRIDIGKYSFVNKTIKLWN